MDSMDDHSRSSDRMSDRDRSGGGAGDRRNPFKDRDDRGGSGSRNSRFGLDKDRNSRERFRDDRNSGPRNISRDRSRSPPGRGLSSSHQDDNASSDSSARRNPFKIDPPPLKDFESSNLPSSTATGGDGGGGGDCGSGRGSHKSGASDNNDEYFKPAHVIDYQNKSLAGGAPSSSKPSDDVLLPCKVVDYGHKPSSGGNSSGFGFNDSNNMSQGNQGMSNDFFPMKTIDYGHSSAVKQQSNYDNNFQGRNNNDFNTGGNNNRNRNRNRNKNKRMKMKMSGRIEENNANNANNPWLPNINEVNRQRNAALSSAKNQKLPQNQQQNIDEFYNFPNASNFSINKFSFNNDEEEKQHQQLQQQEQDQQQQQDSNVNHENFEEISEDDNDCNFDERESTQFHYDDDDDDDRNKRESNAEYDLPDLDEDLEPPSPPSSFPQVFPIKQITPPPTAEELKLKSIQLIIPTMENNNTITIDEILSKPGRISRPKKIVIILRGPPGSGKSYIAKLIKDKEVEMGGSTPRLLSIDDYFMTEIDKEEKCPNTGRKVIKKEMVYEYEKEMEDSYMQYLIKAFKKTINDRLFDFVLVDCVNYSLRTFTEFYNNAKTANFTPYTIDLYCDLETCLNQNIHNRTKEDIENIINKWVATPDHYIKLDVTSLIQSAAIPEVEMEDISDTEEIKDTENSYDQKWDYNEDRNFLKSKWDKDPTDEKLARLDGISKPLQKKTTTFEDYLQMDGWVPPKSSSSGKKTVRWADIEERLAQEKMRAIGFVVGHTDWNRMMDPTGGSSALTKTKYIERVKKK